MADTPVTAIIIIITTVTVGMRTTSTPPTPTLTLSHSHNPFRQTRVEEVTTTRERRDNRKRGLK